MSDLTPGGAPARLFYLQSAMARFETGKLLSPELAVRAVLVLASLCAAFTPHEALYAVEENDSYVETPIDKFDRAHWSFQPVSRPDLPVASETGWCRNEIDQFIESTLHQNGLKPQASASKRTLLRRVSFDLTGLPPTAEQIREFLSDSRPDAYEKLVDRLLESPRYGERWAQHWLDLARFAETDGFEHDKIRDEAWRYRDWVIASFNDDMPYDDFIRRQLAGDELFPGDESAATATRFCLCGPDMPDINLTEERRHSVLNELTSTVGEVFLGLQIGCAQCHDHKYDAISQADFYRMRAIFDPALTLRKNRSLTTLKETFPYSLPSHLMLRGDFRRPGPVIQPGVVRVMSQANSFRPVATKTSSGLRTALAAWLTAPDHPLTARVMVNRIWQHHFGTGLVDTPADFGVMGSDPSHEELFDWLSTTFMEGGWTLKPIHRLIVTSSAYRQRSRLRESPTTGEKSNWLKSTQADPEARLLSRFPRWRLEGEAIRDAMLVVSGNINLKQGGPGVRPPLPPELVSTLLRNQWNVTEDTSEHTRRSIYVFARRNLRYPVFEVFDRPSANASCAVRGSSTTAPQSLHLINSEFSMTISRAMAQSVMQQHSSTDEQIDAAFVRTFARPPRAGEREDVLLFLSESEGTSLQRMTHLCLSLINSNEFVFID